MSDLEQVTATEFKQSVGEYGDKARKHPVMVTRHDRPWVVVLDPEEYERLKQYDTRKSLYPHELDEEVIKELENAKMDKNHDHLNALMK